jgi:hypothetical protein
MRSLRTAATTRSTWRVWELILKANVLEKRGQAPSIDNRIKTKVDYLVGFEKQQRIEPKALPRTPKHETDADGATQGFATSRMRRITVPSVPASGATCWLRAPAASGFMSSRRSTRPLDQQGMMASTAMTPPQEMDIKIAKVAWDRMFADPHSSELDYSDAATREL